MTGKWPAYKVANDDAVYALGVMNINYVTPTMSGKPVDGGIDVIVAEGWSNFL
jgi:hypothetical protein